MDLLSTGTLLKYLALVFLRKIVSRGYIALSRLEEEQISALLGLSLNEINLLFDLWLRILNDHYFCFKPQSCNEIHNFC